MTSQVNYPLEVYYNRKKIIPWCSKDFQDERCRNPRDFARIYFDDCFVINNVTVIQGKENAFVSMPSYKTKEVDENNKPVYRDICYPVTKEFREKLYGEILEMHQLEKEKRLKEGRPLNRRERMQKEMQEQEEKEKRNRRSQSLRSWEENNKPKPSSKTGSKNLISERLIQLRKEHHLSQRELAHQLQLAGRDIDKNVITRIVTNKRYVSDIELKALCKVLQIEYEMLLKE